MNERSKIVVTIHGIRSNGEWQKRITPYLASHNLITYHIDYGFFSAFKFFFRRSRDKQVQKIREELRKLTEHSKASRISIIAHSYGTYIATEILDKDNGLLKYDRVVLTGSIIKLDYDWKTKHDNGLVMAIRNERTSSDLPVRIASFVSSKLSLISGLKAGPSGSVKFDQDLPYLIDHEIAGGHSERHNTLDFERWARFIAYPFLPDDVLREVKKQLEVIITNVSMTLEEPSENIRVGLFAPIDSALRMVPGAFANILHEPEFRLEIDFGHGTIGAAFTHKEPVAAVKRGQSWTDCPLPKSELDKLHPSLEWMLSVPLNNKELNRSEGVIHISGLYNIPVQFQKDLKGSLYALTASNNKFFERITYYLVTAYRGEQIKPDYEA